MLFLQASFPAVGRHDRRVGMKKTSWTRHVFGWVVPSKPLGTEPAEAWTGCLFQWCQKKERMAAMAVQARHLALMIDAPNFPVRNMAAWRAAWACQSKRRFCLSVVSTRYSVCKCCITGSFGRAICSGYASTAGAELLILARHD